MNQTITADSRVIRDNTFLSIYVFPLIKDESNNYDRLFSLTLIYRSQELQIDMTGFKSWSVEIQNLLLEKVHSIDLNWVLRVHVFPRWTHSSSSAYSFESELKDKEEGFDIATQEDLHFLF